MLGKPKYKVNDSVQFLFGNDEKQGVVYIVDACEDQSDVHYDILVETENCLYKHIHERLVSQCNLGLFVIDVISDALTPTSATCRTCVHRLRYSLNDHSTKVIQCCELQPSKRSNSGYKTIKVTNSACVGYEKE